MTRRAHMTVLLWLLVAVLAPVLAGCGHAGTLIAPWERATPPPGLILTDLHDISELRTTFNEDAGKPRMIMLVSPT
jgi:predicted small lipoprotein YifL